MRQAGFTLTELMTTMAIIGLVSASLVAVMNNLNAQSERMNAQTELLVGGRQVINLIKPWAALAGHELNTPVFSTVTTDTLYPAKISAGGDQVTFCYDIDDGERRQNEFRVRDNRLQQRNKDNAGCVVTADENGWENVSEPIISAITFSAETDHTIDLTLDLEKQVIGTDEMTSTTMRVRLPLYALLGV